MAGRILALAAACAMLAAASCTRDIVIEQGINPHITPEQIHAVEGMGADEIRSRLGPPQSRWNLDGQIWIYHFRVSSEDSVREISAEITFGEDGRAAKVEITKIVVPSEGST